MSIFNSDVFKGMRKRERIIGEMAFDVNSKYTSVAHRLAAARSALAATSLGRSGQIQIIADGDLVKYYSPATRETFDTINDAINQVSKYSFSDVRVFGKNLPHAPHVNPKLDRYSTTAAIYEDIHKKIRKLGQRDKEILTESGIDITKLHKLEMGIFTFGTEEKGGVSGLATKLNKLREKGKMQGLISYNDEGARLINFRLGTTELNEYQSALILNMTGHHFHASGQMLTALSKGNPNDIGQAIFKVLEKAPKRQKGFLAGADISLEGRELEEVLYGQTLEESTLILDPQFELLAMYGHMEELGFGKGQFNFINVYEKEKGEALNAYYGRLRIREGGIGKHINEIIENLGLENAPTQDMLSDLRASIRDFSKNPLPKGEWASDALKKHLETNFIGKDTDRKNLVEGLFKNIEQSYDGADLINRKFILAHTKQLRKERDELRKVINDKKILDPEYEVTREQAKRDLAGVQLKLERIRGGDLSQITLRGRIDVDVLGEAKNIKSAAYAGGEFNQALSHFSAIISKFSLKGDTSLGGDVSSLMLSGIGTKGENVYADPVAAAFHPEIFASEDAITAMRIRGEAQVAEYRAFIETGIMPESIESLLKRQATFDGAEASAIGRLSGERNAQIAQMLLDAHKTSNVSDSPFLMSLIHKRAATGAFRDKKGFLQPVMPDTQRFAIASEQSSLGLKGQRIYGTLQGTSEKYGYDKVTLAGTKGTKDVEALLFGIEDGRLVIPHFATGKFHHSLGGFDLDDKGLPRLIAYEDSDKVKRLGTYIFRQPSGPEEIIFARMKFDQNTIKKLFDHDYFNATLNEQTDSKYDFLKEIFGKDKVDTKGRELELEQTVLDILGKAESKNRTKVQMLGQDAIDKLIEHGASSLQARDFGIVPEYTRVGINRTLLEAGPAPDFTSYIKEQAKGTKLEALLQGKNDIEEVQKVLRNNLTESEFLAHITAAEQKYTSKIAENAGGALGVYVNRSMAVGSSLNQIEDFGKQIKGSVVSDFIEKNKFAYTAGILAQETAIDLSVNVGIAQRIHQVTGQYITDHMALDENKLGGALGQLFGIAKNKENVTIDQIGSAMMESLGRISGLSRTLMVGDTNKHLQVGLDDFIISQRMTHLDRVSYIESAIRGMQDVLDNDSLLKHAESMGNTREQIEGQIARYRDISKKSEDDVKKIMLDDFGLKDTAYAKYASLSKIQAVGEELLRSFELLTRNRISAIGKDAILGLSETSDRARGAAEKIIDTHAAALHEVFKEFRGKWEDADELTNYMMSARSSEVGQKVFESIHDAARIEGVTGEHLANAMDRVLMPLGVDLKRIFPIMTDSGEAVSDKAFSGYQIMTKGADLRRYKYYEGLDQTVANEAEKHILSVTGATKITKNNIKDLARQALETQNHGESIVQQTIQALADKSSEIEDRLQRRTAQTNSTILETKYEKIAKIEEEAESESTGPTFASIAQEGTISDFADLGPEASVSEDIFKAAQEGIFGGAGEDIFTKKPVYKRWAEKWGEKEFQELISRPEIKHTLIAGAALVAGSFIYSRHKDRTQSDMAGPPLLPGGSPYETSSQREMPQLETSDGRSYNTGVNYQVHVFGEGDNVQKFHKAAGGLAKGNMHTTMYNRIPNVGKNPYSSFMSSF